jgi:hypothetical protein
MAALFSFAGEEAGEVNLEEGDPVEVIPNAGEEAQGWVEIKNLRTGAHGVVPKDFVGPAQAAAAEPERRQPGRRNPPTYSVKKEIGLAGHHGVLRKMPWEK